MMKAMEKETMKTKAWAVIRGDLASRAMDGFYENIESTSLAMIVMGGLGMLIYLIVGATSDISHYRTVLGMVICFVASVVNGIVYIKVNNSVQGVDLMAYTKEVRMWLEDRPAISKISGVLAFVCYWGAKISVITIVGLSSFFVCATCMIKSEVMVSYTIMIILPFVLLHLGCIILLWKTAKPY